MDFVNHKKLGLKLALDLPDMKKFQLDPHPLFFVKSPSFDRPPRAKFLPLSVDIGPKLEMFFDLTRMHVSLNFNGLECKYLRTNRDQ
jgi:hypothetical protein